jgi:hypothetical protein
MATSALKAPAKVVGFIVQFITSFLNDYTHHIHHIFTTFTTYYLLKYSHKECAVGLFQTGRHPPLFAVSRLAPLPATGRPGVGPGMWRRGNLVGMGERMGRFSADPKNF